MTQLEELRQKIEWRSTWMLERIETACAREWPPHNVWRPDLFMGLVSLFGAIDGEPWTPQREAAVHARTLAKEVAGAAINFLGIREAA